MANLKPEDLKQLQMAFNEAEKDDTPYLVSGGDEMAIVGDPNKTEKVTHDYTVEYRFPLSAKEMLGDNGKVIGNAIVVSVDYEDVFIEPQRDLEIVKAILDLEPFVTKVTEDGNVVDLAGSELRQIVLELERETIHAMYDLVAAVLNLDDEMKTKMLATSAIENAIRMVGDFAAITNEADAFFGLSALAVDKTQAQ